MGIGEAGKGFNLYALMIPYLESNQFQFIASTEPENYARIIEKNGSFARLFHKIDIPSASVEETMLAIMDEAIVLNSYHHIFMTYMAMKELSTLAKKLIHDRVLPDAADSQAATPPRTAGEQSCEPQSQELRVPSRPLAGSVQRGAPEETPG